MSNSVLSCLTWRSHVWLVAFMANSVLSCLTKRSHVWQNALMSDLAHSCLTWHIDGWLDTLISDLAHWWLTQQSHGWPGVLMAELVHSWLIRHTNCWFGALCSGANLCRLAVVLSAHNSGLKTNLFSLTLQYCFSCNFFMCMHCKAMKRSLCSVLCLLWDDINDYTVRKLIKISAI